MRHQLVSSERDKGTAWLSLEAHGAVWASEFKDPVKARATGREALPRAYNHDCNSRSLSSTCHRRQGVDFGMNVVGPKAVLDIASRMDVALHRQHCRSNLRLSMNKCAFSDAPGSMG